MHILNDLRRVYTVDELANPEVPTMIIPGKGLTEPFKISLAEKYKEYQLQLDVGDEFYLVDRSSNKVIQRVLAKKKPIVIATVYECLHDTTNLILIKTSDRWLVIGNSFGTDLTFHYCATPIVIKSGYLVAKYLLMHTSNNESVFVFNEVNKHEVRGAHYTSESGIKPLTSELVKRNLPLVKLIGVCQRCDVDVRFYASMRVLITQGDVRHSIPLNGGEHLTWISSRLCNTIDFLDAIKRLKLLYDMTDGQVSYETVSQLTTVLQSETMERFIRKLSMKKDDAHHDFSDTEQWNHNIHTVGISKHQFQRAYWYFNKIRSN